MLITTMLFWPARSNTTAKTNVAMKRRADIFDLSHTVIYAL